MYNSSDQMIPLRDNVRSGSFPIVNTTLIIANIAVFLYEIYLGDGLRSFIMENGVIPAVVTSFEPISIEERLVPFFTSMFIHGDLFHIIGNMLFLYIFGDNVEDRMGHVKYLSFYILTGLGAAILQIMMNVNSVIPMVGASGAISGVLGAYLLYFPHARVLALVPVFVFIQLIHIPSTIFIGLWFVMQFMSGVMTVGGPDTGGVAFWAHVGGFIAGLVIAGRFAKKNYRQKIFNGYNS